MSLKKIPITMIAALATTAFLSCKPEKEGEPAAGVERERPSEPIATAPPAGQEEPVMPEEVTTGTSATSQGEESMETETSTMEEGQL